MKFLILNPSKQGGEIVSTPEQTKYPIINYKTPSNLLVTGKLINRLKFLIPGILSITVGKLEAGHSQSGSNEITLNLMGEKIVITIYQHNKKFSQTLTIIPLPKITVLELAQNIFLNLLEAHQLKANLHSNLDRTKLKIAKKKPTPATPELPPQRKEVKEMADHGQSTNEFSPNFPDKVTLPGPEARTYRALLKILNEEMRGKSFRHTQMISPPLDLKELALKEGFAESRYLPGYNGLRKLGIVQKVSGRTMMIHYVNFEERPSKRGGRKARVSKPTAPTPVPARNPDQSVLMALISGHQTGSNGSNQNAAANLRHNLQTLTGALLVIQQAGIRAEVDKNTGETLLRICNQEHAQ